MMMKRRQVEKEDESRVTKLVVVFYVIKVSWSQPRNQFYHPETKAFLVMIYVHPLLIFSDCEATGGSILYLYKTAKL